MTSTYPDPKYRWFDREGNLVWAWPPSALIDYHEMTGRFPSKVEEVSSHSLEIDSTAKILRAVKGDNFENVTDDMWVVVDGSQLSIVHNSVFVANYRKEPLPAVEADAVNHPAHYGGKYNPYEAIKVIEAWGLNFNLGNTAKYIARAGKKDPEAEVDDLDKALFYLQRERDTVAARRKMAGS